MMLSTRSFLKLVAVGVASLLLLLPLNIQGNSQPIEAVWIDVRTHDEHAEDNIPNDLNIPHSIIEDEIEYYVEDKNAPLKVYCTLGKRAQKAADKLKEMGYTNVECIGTIERARALRGIKQ